MYWSAVSGKNFEKNLWMVHITPGVITGKPIIAPFKDIFPTLPALDAKKKCLIPLSSVFATGINSVSPIQ